MKEWACKKFYTSKRLTRALEIVSGPLSGAEFKRHAQAYQEIRDLTGNLGGKCQKHLNGPHFQFMKPILSLYYILLDLCIYLGTYYSNKIHNLSIVFFH